MAADSTASHVLDVFVGVDVSKARLDVFVDPAGQRRAYDNTPAGVAQLVAWVRGLGPDVRLIALEATGRYQRRLAAELLDAGLAVAVVNPRQVRDFARCSGRLAKNDRIDAAVLADFARRIGPRPARKVPEKQLLLDERVARRRQVVQMLTMERNHLQQASDKLAVRHIHKLIRVMEQQVQDLDREIAKLVESDDDWKNKSDIVRSAPGVGPQTANVLLAELPELGTLSRQKIAALAGLAPFDRDSGTLRGRRAISGGRAAVRCALYMAALTARRCNPAIRGLAQRLERAGKSFKLVMTACMRKLLVILNVMVREARHWDPKTVAQNP